MWQLCELLYTCYLYLLSVGIIRCSFVAGRTARRNTAILRDAAHGGDAACRHHYCGRVFCAGVCAGGRDQTANGREENDGEGESDRELADSIAVR